MPSGPRRRAVNVTDVPLGHDEQAKFGSEAVDAHERFREAMLRAGYVEHVITKPSTSHARFTPHRGVMRSGCSSSAALCAEIGGDLQEGTSTY